MKPKPKNNSQRTKSSTSKLEDEKQGSLDSLKVPKNKTSDKPQKPIIDKGIDKSIDEMIMEAYKKGREDREKEILEIINKHDMWGTDNLLEYIEDAKKEIGEKDD